MVRTEISRSSPRLAMFVGDRQNNFDCLRLSAAILVIFGHSFAIATGSLADEPLWKFSKHQFHSGTLAVRVFFVISGFLIAASFIRTRHLGVFVRNRFLRIYPGLTVALLVTILMIGPISTTLPIRDYFMDPQTYAYLKTLSLRLHGPNDLLPGVFKDNPLAGSVNGSLWTLFYEVFCYAFVAGLGVLRLLRKRIVLLVLLGSMVIRPLILLIDPSSHILGGESLFLGQAFCSGMVCYFYREHIPVNGYYIILALTGLALGSKIGLGNLLIPLLGSYAILSVAYHPAIRLHHVASRGDFSYGMYIYAFPIQQATVHFLGGPMRPMWNFLIAVPITLLLAVLSWGLVERRFLGLKAAAAQSA